MIFFRKFFLLFVLCFWGLKGEKLVFYGFNGTKGELLLFEEKN
jgi:hypothetical protein